jgi:ribonuclease BN (tRNA processing enzyme)
MTSAQTPDITVTVLGSGTCVPSLERSSCALLLETGGCRLLLDAGPGTMRRLLENGTRIFDVTHLLLSHFHPDHSAELVPFLFANKYPDGSLRKTPLTLGGGKGFHRFFAALKGAYGNWIDLGSGLRPLLEWDSPTGDACHFGPVALATAPMAHNPESLAYRVTGPGGGSVVYSGDTDLSDHLVTLARDADLLVCEAALPDAHKVAGHLTPSEAGAIAAKAGVHRLMLTHFYPECERVDMAAECRRTYTGPLILAHDLLTVVVGPRR